MLADRLVQRIAQPGLQRGVEPGQAQHRSAGLAVDVDRTVERHHTAGQGAGLVGAQGVHCAEVLDRVEVAHDHPARGHPPGAGRKGRAENRRQQLGRQPNGQRDGEHQRVQRRAVEEQVEPEHRGDHHQHDPQQQRAEMAQAALELGFRRAQHQRALDMSQLGVHAAVHRQQARRAAAQRGAAEQAVVSLREAGGGLHLTGLFVDRKGFTGQQRLIDVAVARLDQPAIGGNQAAGGEFDDVAGDDFAGWQVLQAAVAPDVGATGHLLAQTLDRPVRADFVQAADQRTGQHDAQHDQRVQPVVRRQRHQRADQQDQHQRTGQLAHQRGADLPRQARPVRAPHGWLAHRRRRADESVGAALQPGVQRLQWHAPVIRRRRLGSIDRAAVQRVAGEPEAGQHRQPEAEHAKQQGCRQPRRQRHADPAESGHCRGLERAEAARHDADAAQHAGQHEAGEDPGKRRTVPHCVQQRPQGQGIKQHDGQRIAACLQQQARIPGQARLRGAHHRQQPLHPAHSLQASDQSALRQSGD
ncbi:hypothetical protein SSTU70S_00264 [Stutzerimonas stutzeri]